MKNFNISGAIFVSALMISSAAAGFILGYVYRYIEEDECIKYNK